MGDPIDCVNEVIWVWNAVNDGRAADQPKFPRFQVLAGTPFVDCLRLYTEEDTLRVRGIDKAQPKAPDFLTSRQVLPS